MIYERLILMRDLMHEDASIYVHSDWRMNALIRLAMTEVFGANNFINEIVWKRRTGILNQSRKLGASTDSIYLFSKVPNATSSISNSFHTQTTTRMFKPSLFTAKKADATGYTQ
jgi:adenine specific DNA methylase Mod